MPLRMDTVSNTWICSGITFVALLDFGNIEEIEIRVLDSYLLSINQQKAPFIV